MRREFRRELYRYIETKNIENEELEKLKEKEKYISLKRYIIGTTQMELSSELGISQAQISRLEKSGIEGIKRQIL